MYLQLAAWRKAVCVNVEKWKRSEYALSDMLCLEHVTDLKLVPKMY